MSQRTHHGEWVSLWNGLDLKGWSTYLGTPYNVSADSLGNPLSPFGVDHDPLKVITVVDTEEGPAIRISGVAWGMIFTDRMYRNYRLKLLVKWGEGMHPPRADGPRDSGLLYHGFGAPGSAYNWMGSQELQIQEGDMGDYWPVGDVAIDVPVVQKDSLYYQYQRDGDLRSFHFADILSTAVQDSLARRRVYKAMDAEKPHGEWNEIELITWGDSSIHIVNGKVVMRLYNSRKMTSGEPLRSGRIILQSEGAEVYYKDIFLMQLKSDPELFTLKS